MSKTVQTGCIQTILYKGKLESYRCTLPIPREVAEALNYEHCQQMGKKWFYVRTSLDQDKLWYWINLMQVTVNDWKIQELQKKKELALERAVGYSANQD